MSEVQVGPFNITGTDAQIAKILEMAQHVASVLGSRIKNVNVGFYPAKDMPKRADGGPSVGYCPNPHKIMLWRGLRHQVPETFAHEAVHALAGQFFTQQQRQDCLALEQPPGAKWNAPGYADDGSETNACYGSAALFFPTQKPPYTKFYSHVVPVAAYPQLASTMLMDYGAAEPLPLPPQPTPPDDIADLQAQIDELEAANAALEKVLGTIHLLSAPMEVTP